MASHRSLVAPMSRLSLLLPRPAIQAWRGSARSFATHHEQQVFSNDEHVPSGTTAIPVPMPLSTIGEGEGVMPPPPTVDGAYDPEKGAQSMPGSIEAGDVVDTAGDGGEEGILQIPVLPSAEDEDAVVGRDGDRPKRLPVGVVVSSGKMHKTVKVRVPGQEWNSYLRKMYKSHTSHLVHDPNNSLLTGDVVRLRPWKTAKHVHHVVDQILTPFGARIEDRPAVPTEEEMRAVYMEMRAKKEGRRKERVLAAMGQGVTAGEVEPVQQKGGMVGKKGQKLPEGVLPGGEHAVGKIQDRARKNQGKAKKRNQKAEENLTQARVMDA